MSDRLSVALETDYTADALADDPDLDVTVLEREYGRGEHLDPDDLRGVEVFVSSRAEITADTLVDADDLRVIVRTGAGYDNVDLAACTERGILVTHIPQGPTEGVAQATIGLLIACANNVRAYDKRFREEGWSVAGEYRGPWLRHSTVGVIGLGLIGGRVLELLRPFDPEVEVYDPYADPERVADLGAELVGRDEVLKTSDFVSIHVPLTEETHHMLGAEDFRRMKDSAYLINTSRGGIYPDEDLARAIREGWIAGAAIDVFEDEVDASGNPLLELSEEASLHCLFTPHSVASTEGGAQRALEILAEIVGQVRAGEIPRNVLNPAAVDETVPEDRRSPSFRPSE